MGGIVGGGADASAEGRRFIVSIEAGALYPGAEGGERSLNRSSGCVYTRYRGSVP